jgi:hypothetical protein
VTHQVIGLAIACLAVAILAPRFNHHFVCKDAVLMWMISN